MKLSCKPENTLAILVGIEQYADSNWPDLGGPAMDALRMAEWLLNQGVAPERIQLYVNFGTIQDSSLASQREQLLASLVAKGVNEPIEPTRVKLENALNPNSFPSLPLGESGFLLLYFSGHGLSSSSRKSRYAIAADAGTNSWDVINLTVQADNLRLQESCGAYQQQWIIQDACAENLGFGRHLRCLDIDLPETPEVAKQYSLFATRPGEFASTNPTTQSGDFTSTLLQILQSHQLAQLNIETIFSALEHEFEIAFKGNPQRPVLYRIGSDWSERSHSPWAKTACDARNALVAILNTLPINQNKIHSVFRQITHSEETLPSNLADLISALDDYLCDNPTLSNTDLFAIRLAELCSRIGAGLDKNAVQCPKHQYAQQKLEEWLDNWPRKHAAPALVAEQERLARNVRTGASSPIIVLQPFAEQKAKAWRYCDGQWSIDCLPDLPEFSPPPNQMDAWLTKAINEVTKECGIGDNPIIELVLPWERLFERYTGLQIEPEPDIPYQLGEPGLILVLRLEERWSDPKWQRPWEMQWQKIKSQLSTIPQIHWQHAPATMATDRWHWIGASEDNAKAIKKSLYQGAPFALWCAPENIVFVEETFIQCNYLEFHQHFQSIGNLQEGGNHINCLIDDPERIPPGARWQENRLCQPGQRT